MDGWNRWIIQDSDLAVVLFITLSDFGVQTQEIIGVLHSNYEIATVVNFQLEAITLRTLLIVGTYSLANLTKCQIANISTCNYLIEHNC